MRYVLPMRLMNIMRKTVIVILAGAALIVLAVLVLKFNASPKAAINSDYKASAYEYASDGAMLPLEGNTYALIYATRKGELACAVMDKGVLGYQLRSISGFISADEYGAQLSSTFARFFDNYTVTWGLEKSGDIANITVGNAKALTAEYGENMLWVACEKGAIKAGEIVRGAA